MLITIIRDAIVRACVYAIHVARKRSKYHKIRVVSRVVHGFECLSNTYNVLAIIYNGNLVEYFIDFVSMVSHDGIFGTKTPLNYLFNTY